MNLFKLSVLSAAILGLVACSDSNNNNSNILTLETPLALAPIWASVASAGTSSHALPTALSMVTGVLLASTLVPYRKLPSVNSI